MSNDKALDIVIVGAGIGGCALALALHRAGVRSRLLEATPAIRPLGVGLNLLPHAVRELALLGLGERLAGKGVLTQEPISLSVCPFCHGDHGAVGRSRMPIARRRLITSGFGEVRTCAVDPRRTTR